MTADEVQKLVNTAFANVARPDVFTSGCTCDECVALNRKLRKSDTELPDGLAWELPLLSPSAVRYLTPKLIENSLSDTGDEDLGWNFVEMLGAPISSTNPPDSLPFSCEFNQQQCVAVLEFFQFIREHWYEDHEEIPREVNRGICNWQHFAEQAAKR